MAVSFLQELCLEYVVSSTVESNLNILEGNLEQWQWLTLFGVEAMFDPPVQTFEISLQI